MREGMQFIAQKHRGISAWPRAVDFGNCRKRLLKQSWI